MTSQNVDEKSYFAPECDYQAEELSKRLKFSMANFGQQRFIRSMKMQMELVSRNE